MTIGVLLIAVMVPQDLAGAARAAEAQRKQKTGETVVMKLPVPADDESLPPKLTSELVSRYEDARLEFAYAVARDKKLLAALKKELHGLSDYLGAADVYDQHFELARVFRDHRFTARSYLRTEAMLLMLRERWRSDLVSWPSPRTERLGENIAFYRASQSYVEDVLQSCERVEVTQLGLPNWWTLMPPLPNHAP